MKKRLLFGVWEPDAVEMTGGGKVGLSQIENLVPTTRGWAAIRRWYQVYYDGVVLTGTISTYTSICGAISTFDEDGVPCDFLSDTSNVYMADGATKGITTVTGLASGVRPTGVDGFRDFCQYGNYVIAASGNVSSAGDPSYYEHGSSTSFATLTSAFKARTVGAVRDFVVFGNTYDATDGERPTRVRWSAFGDPFTYTPSAATQSDIQDLKADIGRIQRVIGGDVGYIIGTNGVYLMEYVGPPLIFRFTYIHPGIGTKNPQSCVLEGGRLYMFANDGFVSIGPAKGDVQRIGAGRVDRSFVDAVLSNGVEVRVIGYVDKTHGGIGWQFYRAGGTTFSGDAYFYHIASDQWTYHGNRDSAWFMYGSYLPAVPAFPGLTLQTAAAVISGGLLYANAFYNSEQFTIGTGFEELNPGGRAVVEKVIPIWDVSFVAVTAPVMNITAIPNTNIPVGSATSYRSSGTWNATEAYWTGHDGAGFRDARYHKFEIISSSDTRRGEQLLGIDVVFHPRGDY